MLTLGVQNVVVFENILSSLEEVVFDSLLSLLNHSAEEPCGDLFHRRPHLERRILHHVRVEYLPELVFESDIEAALTRVTLSTCSSS